MAALASQDIPLAGLTPAFSAAGGAGDTFVPDEDTILRIKNTSGSPVTVTVPTPGVAAGGLAIGDAVASVPATTGDVTMGPFPREHFAKADGNADIQYSASAGVTVAVLRAPRRF